MQELFNLLNEQKYEEALAGFEKLYQTTNNPIALYYITFIKYYYMKSENLDELYNNFKTLFNYSKEVRMNTYEFYLSFLMDNNDYELAYTISSKAIKETKPNYVSFYAYSRSLAKLNKDLDKAVEYAKKSIEIEDLTEIQKNLAYSNLVEIYSIKRDFTAARETINKMYLVSSNIPYITLLELQIAIDEENEEEINKAIEENLKYEQNKFETYKLLCEYYYNTDQYEEALKYHKLIRPLVASTSFIDEKIAICYLCLDKYDEGINHLKKNPLEDEGHNNYMLGELYFYKWGKANFKQAAEYYEKALPLVANKEKVLKCLGDTYFELVDTTNLKRIIDELHKISKHGYVDYLEASYYRLTQRFDEAENMLKHIKEVNVPKFRINTIIDNCATKPEILDSYHNEAFNKNDIYSLRDCLKFLMFGEHGNKISMDKASKYAEELEKMKDLNTCAYSTLANYYLFKNEDEKAYKLAKLGYDKYLNGEESCQCCGAFVAYCKLTGRGTNKNIEQAYNICKDIEVRELGDVNENAGHVYAECAILLDKDLNRIYELLEKTLFRRYSPSRYFMLVKIGKILNKDTSKHSKLLQESLKHCSERELEYYSKEQTEFLLNNY